MSRRPAAAGLPTPETMDGKSFLPVLLGKADEHKKYTFGIHTTRAINNGSAVFGIRSVGTKTHRYIRNLHPEATFQNNVTTGHTKGVDFWGSWVAKAEAGDEHAQAMVRKYQHRPAEELYDVENDPHCLNNLINDPAYAELKQELSGQLDAWMKDQGDKGRETEANAHARSRRAGAKNNERPAE